MVTAFGLDKIRRAARELDLDGFWSKPVTQATLFNAVTLALDKLHPEKIYKTAAQEVIAASTAALRGIQVLLVEDNAINQDVARGLVGDSGRACRHRQRRGTSHPDGVRGRL